MKRKSPQLFVLLLGIVIALCACGRTTDDPVVVAVRTSNCQTPFYVADARNLAAAHGVEVDLRLVPSNTEIIEGLQRGDFQMGSVPATTAIAAIAQGAPLRIVAMSGRGSDGLLVRRDDGIAQVADLAGKRIATIRASILDVLLIYALEDAGLDPEHDVDIVYMSTLGDMISALKTGQIDATSNTEPFMTDSEDQGWAEVLTYYGTSWPDHPCCVVVARESFVTQQPLALEAVLAAHLDAVDWTNSHLDEAAEISVSYLGAFDAELVAKTLCEPRMRLDYRLDKQEMEVMAQRMLDQGLLTQLPPAGDWVDTQPLQRLLDQRP